jgi:hypothetical protein
MGNAAVANATVVIVSAASIIRAAGHRNIGKKRVRLNTARLSAPISRNRKPMTAAIPTGAICPHFYCAP